MTSKFTTVPVRRQTGSAVMIILLIMITGSAAFLLTQLNKGNSQQPRSIDTRYELTAIQQALVGHAQMNAGCLPCPSISPVSGLAPAKPCPAAAGYLPWQTLSLGDLDNWGRRYRYVVDTKYTNACVTTDTNATLSVNTRNSAGTPVLVANKLVAVVLSHGINGYGGHTANGVALPNPPAGNSDEQNNFVGTTSFWARAATDNAATTGGPFDDQLVYISQASLVAQSP